MEEKIEQQTEKHQLFIQLEQIKAGKSLNKLLVQSGKYIDEMIDYYKQKLSESLKEEYSEKIIKIRTLLKTDVKDLTKKERKKVYSLFKKQIFDKNLIKPFKKLTVQDISLYQKLTLATGNYEHFYSDYYKKQIHESIKDKEENVYLSIKKDDVFEDIELLENIATDLINKGKKVYIVIDQDMKELSNDSPANYLYNAEQFNQLIELNNNLKLMGMPENIKFTEFHRVKDKFDYKDCWDIEQVKNANNSLDQIVEFIQSQHFSPYETMLFIHNLITKTFEYREGYSSVESPRVIVGAINKREIVCSGYSSMTKAIIDKLGLKDLSCEIIGCSFLSTKGQNQRIGAHCQCLIKIDDEKYNISGSYINDACWDSKNKVNQKGRGFAHCMFPVGDLMNLKDTIYVQKFRASRFDSLVFSTDDLLKVITNSKLQDYKERKSYASEEYLPEIVEKYQNNSTPITLDKTKQGLKVVFSSLHENENQQEIDKRVEDAIEMSKNNTTLNFSNEASSEYLKDLDKNKSNDLTQEIEEE